MMGRKDIKYDRDGIICRRALISFIIIFSFLIPYISFAQQSSPPVMFWNVENFFDTQDNPDTEDDEFTPFGDKHWTKMRFKNKRNIIAKTIISVKEEYHQFPFLIGLAEVENKYVLNELIENTLLSKIGYNYIHRNSCDPRGIECALLYREDYFVPVDVENIEVKSGSKKLRHILYVKGLTDKNDTMHVFVLHFPSKLGGAIFSQPYRETASLSLIHKVDSIYTSFKNSFRDKSTTYILIMGDFNDTPESVPVSMITSSETPLINKAEEYLSDKSTPEGSIKFRGVWELIDQFIVSYPLSQKTMVIYAPDFLLENDDRYLGRKPHRTYNGPRYLNGASDHLPILLISGEK